MAPSNAACREWLRIAFMITVVTISGAAASGQAVGPEIPIWVEAINSSVPSVAFNINHEEFLVVWSNEQGPNTRDVFARRVRLDGSLDTWFAVATGADQKHFLPAVAFNPLLDNYLVVWVTEAAAGDDDLWGSIVAWNGSAIGNRFSVNLDVDRQTWPVAAFNANAGEYLVVYENVWASGFGDVAAQRVAGDGTLLSWANVATSPGILRSSPSVGFHPDLDQYLIAYQYVDPMLPHWRLHGKIAAPDLLGISMAPEIVVFDNGVDDAINPAVTASTNGYIVQFSQIELYVPAVTPIARRVAADGTPLGPATGFQLGEGPPGNSYMNPSRSNAVANSDAVGYVSAWRDAPSGFENVSGQVISPQADNLLSRQLVVATGPEFQRQVAIACAPWGTCLVVHESDDNIVGRMIRLNVFGDGFEDGTTNAW